MRLSDEQRALALSLCLAGEGLDCTVKSKVVALYALDLADELAAAQRREKRLKRQVELMGWLIGSHEADIHELAGYAKVRGGWPSFDQMGDPSDEGEYTDDDLDMLKDHWPAAREELERRLMAADNADDFHDAAADHYWRTR